MGFDLHAEGTNDPKDVRNWRIHLIAIIASMSAIASKGVSFYSASLFEDTVILTKVI